MNSIVTVFRLAVLLPLVIAALVAIAVAPMGPTAAGDFVAEVQPWPGGRLLVRLTDDHRTSLEVARDRVRALKDRLGM